MSNQTNGPRDIVEGGPERPPNGQEERDQTGRRGATPKQPEGSESERKNAPQHRDDVTYQPESGQPGAD
jgi:hypothetical protein